MSCTRPYQYYPSKRSHNLPGWYSRYPAGSTWFTGRYRKRAVNNYYPGYTGFYTRKIKYTPPWLSGYHLTPFYSYRPDWYKKYRRYKKSTSPWIKSRY